MKILVAIPAYHRPLPLAAVVTALHSLASGKHEIHYRIGIDDDDRDGYNMALQLSRAYSNVSCLVAPAPATLGEKSNRLLAGQEADYYLWLADDVIPLAQHWDEAISEVDRQYRLPAFCWNELNQPGQPSYPILSRQFVDALAGKPFPEWFPFWFLDTWIAEVYLFCFGTPMTVIKGLDLGGQRGISSNLRDVPFWYHFFIETRIERYTLARHMAECYGIEAHSELSETLAPWDHRALMMARTCPETDTPPSLNYLKAKELAKNWLDQLGEHSHGG